MQLKPESKRLKCFCQVLANSAKCPTCSDNMQMLELSQNAVVWYCYNCQEAKRNVTDPRDTIKTDQDTGTATGPGAYR